MSKDQSLHDYVLNDLFSGIEGITSSPMFGGFSFYKNKTIFAMIADGKLYFKVGDGNRADYQLAGSKPFSFQGQKGIEYTMSYWELPADVMEDKTEIITWIEKSVIESQKKKK